MPGPVDDVVVTNAVLQWVPEHRELLPRWLAALPAGAWFAMQVPGNFGAPSHVLLRELAAEPQWAGAVRLRGTETVSEPADYADLLAAGGAAAVDVWETTYLQRLTGPDPVLTLDGRHCAATRARRPGRRGRRVRRVHCRAGTAVARGVPAAAGREHVVPVPADLRGRADLSSRRHSAGGGSGTTGAPGRAESTPARSCQWSIWSRSSEFMLRR